MAEGRPTAYNQSKGSPSGQHHPSITYLQKSMNLNDTSNSDSIGSFQPSKAFLEKCVSAQKTLLELINPQYHDQLENLYQNELEADIFVQIGDFVKPLHGCILASRVFRFYNTLKLFRSNSAALKNKFSDKNSKPIINHREYSNDISKPIYLLPTGLISPGILNNFARRIYLDEDVKEEELRLTAKFGEWLKTNKPHLINNIHIPNSYSPDHKTSFRTIIPNFEVEESNSDRSVLAKPTELDSFGHNLSLDKMDVSTKNSNDAASDATPQQDNCQQSSEVKGSYEIDATGRQQLDCNLATQSVTLARTETFEKISSKLDDINLNQQLEEANKYPTEDDVEGDLAAKCCTGQIDGTNCSQSSNMNAHLNSSQDDDRSDYGADISSVDGSNPPTPTFMTQSKNSLSRNSDIIKSTSSSPIVPKQGISTTLANQKIINSGQTSARPSTTATTEAMNKNRAGSTSSSNSNSPAIKVNRPIAQKRSTSITSAIKGSTTATIKAQQPSNPIVTRAKPISLERAQSPILIGKQSRHQLKATQNESRNRMVSGHHNRRISNQQTGSESETFGSEVSDSGSYALESSSGLYLSVDRHSLASYSKLAEAMTRMFLDEIEADVILNVGHSKQIKAHKCILATRSAYLAEAIERRNSLSVPNNHCDYEMAGKTIQEVKSSDSADLKQNLDNIRYIYINLTDFSYPTVHFAVLHLYSGIVKVTDDLELEELTKLTNLLHVSTLRQVCQHNLRMTYCHFFHKPCNVCALGVLKTLPLAWRYDYSDLYAKCLQWIGTNFANIFCLREFSELRPTDLIEECYTATLNQLQPDNIIQRTLECQKLLKNLPRLKWTESIIGLVGRQLEDFCHYVADNYDKIIETDSFMSLAKNCWECEILEENLLAAMNHLKPDMGCKCLVLLHKIECVNETLADDPSKHYSESFANLVGKMRKYCERYLIREAAQVVHCPSWRQMNPSLQRKIKDQALITVDFDDPSRQLGTRPKLTSSISKRSSQVQYSSQKSSSDEGNKSSSTRPSYGPGVRLPPMRNKQIVSRHVKVLK